MSTNAPPPAPASPSSSEPVAAPAKDIPASSGVPIAKPAVHPDPKVATTKNERAIHIGDAIVFTRFEGTHCHAIVSGDVATHGQTVSCAVLHIHGQWGSKNAVPYDATRRIADSWSWPDPR